MTRFDQAMHLAAVCVVLLFVAPLAMAQSKELASRRLPRPGRRIALSCRLTLTSLGR